MMQQYFESMISGIEAKLQEDPSVPNPRKKFALQTAKLGQRMFSGKNKVAWSGVSVPFDLLNAMGVSSCFVEFVGAMLASTGSVGPLLQEAEQAGYAADTCGYHRAVMGAALKGLMPIPDFFIASTCPCSGGLATIENLARTFNKDLFVLHIPQEETSETVAYLADQFKDMVQFVESHTGEALDQDRLRESIENTNQARAFMDEAYQLAQQVPSPATGRDLSNFGIVMTLSLGSPEAVEVAKAFRDEFSNRIKAGISGVPGEKKRILWIQNRIQFQNFVVPLLEKEYQTNVVVDELNDITWDPIDPEKPYEGMARRAISIPFNGNIEQRTNHLKYLAKSYKIDGAINPCHWGCRQGTGARGLIDSSFKEIGIPVLNLEVDCIDDRNFAEGQLRTRLQAFLEMLMERGSNPKCQGSGHR